MPLNPMLNSLWRRLLKSLGCVSRISWMRLYCAQVFSAQRIPRIINQRRAWFLYITLFNPYGAVIRGPFWAPDVVLHDTTCSKSFHPIVAKEHVSVQRVVKGADTSNELPISLTLLRGPALKTVNKWTSHFLLVVNQTSYSCWPTCLTLIGLNTVIFLLLGKLEVASIQPIGEGSRL